MKESMRNLDLSEVSLSAELQDRQLDVTLKILLAPFTGASIPTFKTGCTVVIFFLHINELARYGILHAGGLTLYKFK